jgi:chemotaxis protein methyltransferase CheR
MLPALLARANGPRPLVVWSAGCAAGQEAYSLAMSACELGREAAGAVRIIATDLSRDAVARATAAHYSLLEVNRGLPAAWLVRYFQEAGTGWEVRPEIRAMVDVRRANLTLPWPPVPRVDVIFARYVLMYLHLDVRRKILEIFRKVLAPDGYLVIGATETLMGVSEGFERMMMDKLIWYRPRVRPGRSSP